MKNKKTIFFLSVASVIFIIVLCPVRKLIKYFLVGAEVSQTSQTGFDGSRAQSPVVTTNLEHHWGSVGDVVTYRVNYSLRMLPNDSSFTVTTPLSDANIRGTYHVVVIKTTPEKIILGTQFSKTQVTSLDRSSVMEKFLNTTPVAICFSRQGQILEYRFPSKAGKKDKQFLEGMNSIQVVLSSGNTWNTREADGTGKYNASYLRQSEGKICKKKNIYVSLNNAYAKQSVSILESSITATLGSFWIESYRGKEITKLSLEGNDVLTSESEVTLLRTYEKLSIPAELKILLEESRMVNKFADIWSSDGAGPIEESGIWVDQDLQKLEEKYKNVSFQQVFSDFLDANKQSSSHANHLPSILALKDWLLVHPEGARKIAEVLLDNKQSQELSAQLVYVLQLSSSNVISQQVLAEILDGNRGYPKSVQVQAAVAAGDVENIAPQLYDALLKMAFDPADLYQTDDYASNNAALLALGVLALKDTKIAEMLADNLSNVLNGENSTPVDVKVTSLLALKNGAIYNQNLENAAQALLISHGDEQVRLAALDYLSASKSEHIQMIEDTLDDPSESIRIKSLEILAASKNPSESAISTALLILGNNGNSELLRNAAVDMLAPLKTTDARVSSMFKKIKADQSDASVAAHIDQNEQ